MYKTVISKESLIDVIKKATNLTYVIKGGTPEITYLECEKEVIEAMEEVINDCLEN